jgi:phage baseplate assembly protein W
MPKYNSEFLRVNLYKKGPEFYQDLEVKSEKFAYDLSDKIFVVGEVTDHKAINMSIKNICLTTFGNLLFEPGIGSSLGASMWEGMTVEKAENILDNLIEEILRIETRITIDSSKVNMNIYEDRNAIEISIPYKINSSGIESLFKQRVIV